MIFISVVNYMLENADKLIRDIIMDDVICMEAMNI